MKRAISASHSLVRLSTSPVHVRRFLLATVLVLIAIGTSATAQSGVVYLPPANSSQTKAKPTSSQSKAMTVDDVIKMSKAGLSDDLIIQQIRKKGQPFDLSADQIIELKNAPVSERVIEVMINPAGSPVPPAAQKVVTPPATSGASATSVTSATPTASASAGNAPASPAPAPVLSPSPSSERDSNDPLSDHDPGIYIYYKDHTGEYKLTQLEPTVYTQSKMGGVFTSAMTYGIAKMHWKAVVNSPHAVISLNDHSPVFYFYFETKGAGLSYASISTSTPNEFALLKFEQKKHARETAVMEGSMWGMQSGTSGNALTPFTYTKIRPGVFKVTLTTPLNSGEYCFFSSPGYAFASGAGTSNRLFDFGIERTR